MMNDDILALLVHDRKMPMEHLESALNALFVRTFSLGTCRELRSLVREVHADLVFTDTVLPDGSWGDVVDLMREAGTGASVVTVGSHEDVKLYCSILDRGGFDLVLPPFESQELKFVVDSALHNTRFRLRELARVGHA